MTSLEYDWTCALSGLVYSEQGGQKLISDGFFPIISNFLLYETQKDGGPLGIPGTPSSIPPGPDSEQNSLRSPAIQRNDILVDNLTKIDWQSAARCTVWT